MTPSLEDVIAALRTIRMHSTSDEYQIHVAVSTALTDHGIDHAHEVRIAERSRIDFVAGRVGVEVKRGKPNTAAVAEQLERYCASDQLDAVILVTERGLFTYPRECNGKRVERVVLSKRWGLAT